jgi:hypothetical protein
MSRVLPVRPNLDFLKNEAKDRLDELRKTDPRAQLANAQFAIANDYGFASWPKLKAHVESLAAAADHSPLVGDWIANVAQSRRHPSNQFRSGRIDFAIRGNVVEIVDEYVDEAGKPLRGRNTLEADGAARATGATLGARGLDTVAKKDGQVIGRATYTVSADGRTLTIEDDSGDSMIVLDRLIQ